MTWPCTCVDPQRAEPVGAVAPLHDPTRRAVVDRHALGEHDACPRRHETATFCSGRVTRAPLIYGRPTVVAIHSLNEAETGTHAWWYRFTYGALYARCARGADKVIVPSVSTADDMKAQYDLAPDKIEVVPLGVDPVFKPAEDDDACRAVRSQVSGVEPALSSSSSGSCRSGGMHPLLIEAFALAKRRLRLPHYLLFFGPNHLRLPLGAACRTARRIDDSRADGRTCSIGTRISLRSTTVPISISMPPRTRASACRSWKLWPAEHLS